MITEQQELEKINKAFNTDMLPQILDFISDNLYPSDVFSEEVLEEWAEDNGYVKRFE